MARPAFEPTLDQRRTVMQLASIGVSVEEIGHVIGDRGAPIDPKTIRKHCRDELNHGAALCGVRVKRKLHELIDQGNPAVIFFYLKCRDGWRETTRMEATGVDGAPLPDPVVRLYLPIKDTVEPLRKVAETPKLDGPPDEAYSHSKPVKSSGRHSCPDQDWA